MSRRRPARALGSALSALLVCLSALVTVPATAAAPSAIGSAAAQASRAVLSVHVAALEPVIATPGQDVRAQVRVRNTGASPTTGPVLVSARLGAPGAMITRSQVRAFARAGLGGPGFRTGTFAAQTVTDQPLPPDTETVVDVTIPGNRITSNRTFGVLPLQFDATEETESGADSSIRAVRATYLPYQSRKEYQPLDVSVVVPLTLDPDPALITATGQQRAEAWAEAIGPDSRIESILAATDRFPVTWAVDPALLDTPGHVAAGAGGTSAVPPAATGAQSPAATPGAAAPEPGAAQTPTPPEPQTAPPATPSPTPTPTDPAEAAQGALRERLAGLATRHPVWALPRNDPDLRAIIAAGASPQYLSGLLGSTGDARVAALLGLPGMARVAWPAGPGLSSAGITAVRAGFGGDGPSALVAPGSVYDENPDVSGSAARVTGGGLPVVTFDDELSALFTSASDPAVATELTLRTLAETVTLLSEAPGRQRSIVIAAGRDFDPDVGVARGLLTTLQGTPWVRLTDTSALLDAQTTRAPVGERRADATDPLSPGDSPLTSSALSSFAALRAPLAGLAGVLTATPTSAMVPDLDSLDGLVSTRWRFAPGGWKPTQQQVSARVEELTTGVSVVPSTFNFFAEHGALQVTVVNDLDVDVHDVRVVLEPQGRPPRLRIVSEPAPMTIRAGSRTTVRVQAEAVAAGIVPVSTHLATPTNTRLGTDATVRVRVQPTNGWIMLALGGLIGVVFVAGLYRALRMGRPRVPSESLKDIN
ncbi:hypothetical protein BJY21_002226 [Kineosphaera limosa]|uniref:Glycoprotein n=1 Tax=Kineosphaera limosa NBRC 100340 TaxID=1184609 RepID=K6WTK6_9MICO|nr:DUF6049 family protein [Kineosphaera limosa]NYE01042.1 hypothetical protein [Kineosphaera limosa]GAB95427.1 hypothetical protein KILIM_019_00810 [Kineosphaera limosa NBRC 100340]